MIYINLSKPRVWQNTAIITVEAGETKTVSRIPWKKDNFNNNGNVTEAGDLAMMKDASVFKIDADLKYDLNANGIYADAGDSAMLRDAAAGKIELV